MYSSPGYQLVSDKDRDVLRDGQLTLSKAPTRFTRSSITYPTSPKVRNPLLNLLSSSPMRLCAFPVLRLDSLNHRFYPHTNILVHTARTPRLRPSSAPNTKHSAASSTSTLHRPRPSRRSATHHSFPLQRFYTSSRPTTSGSKTGRTEDASTAPGSPSPQTQ